MQQGPFAPVLHAVTNDNADLKGVLQQYQLVFVDPQGLPRIKSYNHAIPLMPNTQPVNVRFYRYSQYQKNEIERLVVDMLQSQLIQPSISSYASPVLLVKKKNGTWRFCMDYNKLNER